VRLAAALISIAISIAFGAGVARARQPEEAESTEASPKQNQKQPQSKGRAKPAGHAVPEEQLRRKPPPRPSGNIHLFHVFHGEALKVNIYNADGSYDVEALRAVSHLLRCTKTAAEKDVDPRLLTVLSHVYDHFGGRPIEVTSGYRNQLGTTSYHFKASATDILLEGVKPTVLRAFVESLDTGGMGIGLYPRSGFVHVDVRPLPSYRWIDYAPVDPSDPRRAPMRGWKRKGRLQS
jgi:uncharacterized protein YcbK (DUF882 family)